MGEPVSPDGSHMGGDPAQQTSTPNGPPSSGVQSPPLPSDGAQGIFPSGYHDGKHDWDHVCDGMRGAEIHLKIVVSSCGSQDVEKFMGTEHFVEMYMGEDVIARNKQSSKAKHLLSQQLSVDYGRISLFVGSKLMMDPLSLCDIPEISPDSIMELRAELK